MGKKLLAIMAVLAVLVLPASPAVRSVVAHGNQPCYDGDKVDGLHSGNQANYNASMTGVAADIEFHYDTCDGDNDDDKAVAAWVALTPDNNPGVIIQAGIIQCKEGGIVATVCRDHPNELRYFFAYGGCTFLNWPYARDAGPASGVGFQHYRVDRNYDGWVMYLPNGNAYFVSASNPAVSCIGSSIGTNVQYSVEKWDRGDSSGGSTTKTHFINTKRRDSRDGLWYLQTWGSTIGLCQMTAPTAPHYSRCEDQGDDIWVWD